MANSHFRKGKFLEYKSCIVREYADKAGILLLAAPCCRAVTEQLIEEIITRLINQLCTTTTTTTTINRLAGSASGKYKWQMHESEQTGVYLDRFYAAFAAHELRS